MTFSEYIPLALRTECDRSSCNEQNRLLHAAIGAMTESTELSHFVGKANFVEELGDILWYMAIALDALGRKELSETQAAGTIHGGNALRTICVESANLLDQMKKNIFYGKQYDRDDYARSCEFIIHCIRQICVSWAIKFEDVLKANIRKLTVRYPEKFTDEAAINRDLDSERRALA